MSVRPSETTGPLTGIAIVGLDHTAAAVLFVLLVALEWLFWLSPFQAAVNTMTRRMGAWLYLFSPHYGARLLLLLMALWVWKPTLWPVFAPGAGWFYSVALGVAYILLISAVGPRFGLIEHRTFWPRVQA